MGEVENGGDDVEKTSPPPSEVKYMGWKAMPYIIGNETFEKLGTLGTAANLLIYLTGVFHMKSVAATTLLNVYNGTASFAPLVGAFLSDAFLGRYATMAFASVISFLGMLILTLTAAISGLHPPECKLGDSCRTATPWQLAVLFSSFVLLVIGSGGIRPCSMPFGADQFDPTTEAGKRGINSFFNWYYFTFAVALVLSSTVIIYVQSNVSWPIGLGIPALLMLIACAAYFLGTRIYVKVSPEGSPFTSVVQVLVAALRKRKLPPPRDPNRDLFDPPHRSTLVSKLLHTNQFRCLDKAAIVASEDEVGEDGYSSKPWRLCRVQQVEEVKCLLRIMPIWSSGIIFYVAIVQQTTYVVLSALQSDRHLGKRFEIPAASFTVFATLAQAIWIPLYDRLLIPWLRRVTGKEEGITLLQRMGIGILLSTAAMFVSAMVEDRRRSVALQYPSLGTAATGGAVSAMSSLWMIPQLSLLGIAEAFNLIGQIEFYYKEIPEQMRSVAGALAFLNLSFGNYVSSLLVTILNAVTRGHGDGGSSDSWLAQDLNKGRLDLFYLVIAGIGVINFAYYVVCARWYRFKGAQ